jgi:hypothetical protein
MRSVLLLTCLTLFALPAHGQVRQRSDSLPRELVTALLGGSMGSRTIDIQSGMADDSLPAVLFRDALILGFADLRSSVMTVAYFPFAPEATLDTIKARLGAAGWTSPASPGSTERGFVSTYGGPNPMALCRGRSVVMPSVSQRTISRTLAVITRQFSQGAAEYLCGNRSELRERMRNPAADTPLPALYPPPGMRSGGGGSGGTPDGGRAMEMYSSLTGDLPLTDIQRHYADQFTKAGWRRVEELASATMAMTSFEITGTDGRQWHCVFSVSIPSVGNADISLKLRLK